MDYERSQPSAQVDHRRIPSQSLGNTNTIELALTSRLENAQNTLRSTLQMARDINTRLFNVPLPPDINKQPTLKAGPSVADLLTELNALAIELENTVQQTMARI